MAESIGLDGEWLLYGLPAGTWEASRFSPAGDHHPRELARLGIRPIPARVPGNVELDCQRAGLIPDPFYAENIHTLRGLETHEWWYLKEFPMPASSSGQTWELVFDGLDTLATVWVNGIEVGRAENMLIGHRFDVTAALKAGEQNQVAVRLASALTAARGYEYDAASLSWERREEGLYLRKPPHCWGWDIMPRAVSAGIWRSVRLEQKPPCAFEQLYYWTASISAEGALLGVRFQFRAPTPDLDGYAIRFEGRCADHSFTYEHPVEFVAGGCAIPIPGARLWQPRGAGEPHLYTLTARLTYEGQTLAQQVDRIGLRKLELRRTEIARQPWTPAPVEAGKRRLDAPPDPESCFVFFVNGDPIQVKGTNWVPLDAFHSQDSERLLPALELAADLGCNMIRCWGGNVYEDDRFFDFCDSHGILVWQDLAFACCRYPQTEEFLDKVRQEVRAVAFRLRNHPSLAVWCGDNEVDMVYQADGLSPENNRLTRQAIPETLHRFDPHRPYIPSSPYIAPRQGQGAGREPWRDTPEQHLWGPRGYFKSPFYTRHSAHFIGEIGYHGCPNASSIRRFLPPTQVWPWQDNPAWRAHDVTHLRRGGEGRDRIRLMANQVRELFGEIPADLETFVLASQIAQAEAKKFFIESTRQRKWFTSGVLWWNLLDGWPQFSDAVVDYYFEKKLAYYYIRRAQQPVCLFLGEPGPEKYLPLIASNDSLVDVQVRFRVWDADNGETLLEGETDLPANQNWQVDRLRHFVSDQRLYLIGWETGGQKYGNHYLSGFPPLSLERYRRWLPRIAALPQPFDPQAIGR